jgi:hypothetical protein
MQIKSIKNHRVGAKRVIKIDLACTLPIGAVGVIINKKSKVLSIGGTIYEIQDKQSGHKDGSAGQGEKM